MVKKILAVAILGIGVWSFVITSFADETQTNKAGEAEFNEHCVMCHPGGGNVINPQKTLHKKDLEGNNIKTAEDIVKIMRNPGTGMPKFDESAISDKAAKMIAEYIIATFK